MKSAPFAVMILVLACAGASAQTTASSTAARLANLINAYRVEHGLSVIPASRSLTQVAQAHVEDLELNRPAGACNGHSWSAAGEWTPCC
jgi:uncharacterized protein YkwD